MSRKKGESYGLANLVTQMQEFSQSISASLQLQEFASNMLEAQKQLLASLEPIVHSQLQVESVIRSLALDRAKITQPILEFRKQIEGLISPVFEEFIESFRLLPGRTQAALIALGNYGWFFDLEMPLPFLWELEKALENGNLDEAEVALMEYFREHLSTIENRLNSKFPHRAKIISTAFNAHKRGEYELSIPVFLAQTDGICYEVVNQHLFMKKNKKPSTAAYVETIASDTFRSALLSPLSHPLPISASEHERGERFDELNRHQVLHGETLHYGTEVNSLKSISLLNYVTQVLRLDDKKDP